MSPKGRVSPVSHSGFQGLKGKAHPEREEIHGGPITGPLAAGEQWGPFGIVTWPLCVQNQRLQTNSLDFRPGLWMNLFGLKMLSQHFKIGFLLKNTDFQPFSIIDLLALGPPVQAAAFIQVPSSTCCL